MAAPKTPQDRKAKATNGFTAHVAGQDWRIDPEALDDFELLDDLGEVEAGNAARLPRVLRRLLGDQYPAALEALRDETTGRVPLDPATAFVNAVFEGIKQGNPSGS